jgi:hypothetical protein
MHDLQVGLWCVINAWRKPGPNFFYDETNPERRVRFILSPFFDQLNDEDKSYGHFM